MLGAANIAVEAVLVVIFWLGPPAICVLKGKSGMAVLGLVLLGVLGWIAAIRLAKPNSWWAQHFYDETKLEKARLRHPDEAQPEPFPVERQKSSTFD